VGLASLKLEEIDTEIKFGWVNRWMIEGLNRDITGSSVLFELGKSRLEHLDIKKLGRNTHCRAWRVSLKRGINLEKNTMGMRVTSMKL
jgi:hypothetical protein